MELKQYVMVYVDDILITTPTFEKHVEVLQKLLNIFSRNGLTVQIDKSLICQRELQFLGFVLSREGIKIRPDKCKSIIEMPRPDTPTKVRSFLGSLSYNRRFIKDFVVLVRPLHQLTSKGGQFKWTDECERSFQTLTTAPILTPIDYDRKLLLITDDCDEGIGANLAQMDEAGKNRHIVAYYSRSLNDHERAYTISEKEALAVVPAVKAFATYLRFNTFEVVTDHQPLKCIFKESVSNRPQAASRILRWGIFLTSFDLSIRFASGDSPEIRQTDWLSRESYVPATQHEKEAALKLNPETRIRKEMDCPDCVPEPPDRAVMGVGTHDAVTQTNSHDLPGSGSGKTQANTPVGNAKDSPMSPEQKDAQSESFGEKEFDIVEKQEFKKIFNYFIPYDKIYKRMDKYKQQAYPSSKLKQKQSEDKFCQQIRAYLQENTLPSETRWARYITVLAEQFIVKDDLMYHVEIPAGGVAEQVFRLQLYMPESLRDHVMNEVRQKLHMSVEKLVQKVKLEF